MSDQTDLSEGNKQLANMLLGNQLNYLRSDIESVRNRQDIVATEIKGEIKEAEARIAKGVSDSEERIVKEGEETKAETKKLDDRLKRIERWVTYGGGAVGGITALASIIFIISRLGISIQIN